MFVLEVVRVILMANPKKVKRAPVKSRWAKYPRATEILGGAMEVDKFVEIDSICGKELLLVDFVEREGAFGKYYTVKCEQADGKTVGFNTGSDVLMKQLDKLKEHIPVIITIQKRKRYYTIV